MNSMTSKLAIKISLEGLLNDIRREDMSKEEIENLLEEWIANLNGDTEDFKEMVEYPVGFFDR